jgi:hypothetical protein
MTLRHLFAVYRRYRFRVNMIALFVAFLYFMTFLFLVPRDDSNKVRNTRDLQVVCNPGRAVGDAAAYKLSSTVSPTALMVQGQHANDTSYDLQTDDIKGADLANFATTVASFKDVQLVACLSRTSETATSQTCTSSKGPLTVYQATYKMDLYEAKTRKLLKTADISAEPQFDCPPSYKVVDGQDRAYVPPSFVAVHQELAPFVKQ